MGELTVVTPEGETGVGRAQPAWAVAESLAWWRSSVSLVVAPANDVSTADWFSLNSLGAGLRDYATVLGGAHRLDRRRLDMLGLLGSVLVRGG